MKKLRFWSVALLTWFFLFYNLERLGEPLNIASFVYILSAILAILIILLPGPQKVSVAWLFAGSFILFLGLKWLLGYQIFGRGSLPLTVTEIGSLWLTIMLASTVHHYLAEFENSVFQVMINHFKNLARPFEIGQSDMYREVHRARQHKRPLTVLAVVPGEESVEHALDRFSIEALQASLRKYAVVRLAQLLSEELRDYDLIAQRNNHLITLLPGINGEEVSKIIQKLESAAREKLGLTVKIGSSTFPEEVTLEKLIEQAEAGTQERLVPQKHPEEVPANAKVAL